MNAIPELIPLHDSRPGLRSLLQVEVRDVIAAPASEGEGVEASSATLDFVASTATLDRYHEVIEPAGWRLDTYRNNLELAKKPVQCLEYVLVHELAHLHERHHNDRSPPSSTNTSPPGEPPAPPSIPSRLPMPHGAIR